MNNKKQNKHKNIGFTKGEWKKIKGTEYTDDDNRKLEINIININKSTGIITVEVNPQDIQNNGDNTNEYKEITKQFINKNKQYVYLEDVISRLAVDEADKSKDALKLILEYTKKIHDHYQGLPYGEQAREANHHALVASVFNHCRYGQNIKLLFEQLAGRGYADIVLLVRGPDRATHSIPIIMELKAGTRAGTNIEDALKQCKEYTEGFQPNNMRILSLADNILCVGINLDSPADSFMATNLVSRQTRVIPLIQQIINQLVTKDILDPNVAQDDLMNIKQTIRKALEKTHNTFPGTGEKSSAHYFSRFILAESLVLGPVLR